MKHAVAFALGLFIGMSNALWHVFYLLIIGGLVGYILTHRT